MRKILPAQGKLELTERVTDNLLFYRPRVRQLL